MLVMGAWLTTNLARPLNETLSMMAWIEDTSVGMNTEDLGLHLFVNNVQMWR